MQGGAVGHVAAVLKQSGRNLPKGYSKAQRTLEYTKRGVARERSVESPVQRRAVQCSPVQCSAVQCSPVQCSQSEPHNGHTRLDCLLAD
eukprot:COSAG06_NODE_1619_length_8908_cov_3.222727_10_plen_89_part_00